MTLYCSFSSHIEACTAIGNVAEQSGVQLFQRPWNFYEPDTTAWWLIPSAYDIGTIKVTFVQIVQLGSQKLILLLHSKMALGYIER